MGFIGRLNVLDLSQTEFKLVVDARNEALNIHGLEVLRKAYDRQQNITNDPAASEDESADQASATPSTAEESDANGAAASALTPSDTAQAAS